MWNLSKTQGNVLRDMSLSEGYKNVINKFCKPKAIFQD